MRLLHSMGGDMRVRLLIALAVVGFCAPWIMVAQQMQQATPLQPAELEASVDGAER